MPGTGLHTGTPLCIGNVLRSPWEKSASPICRISPSRGYLYNGKSRASSIWWSPRARTPSIALPTHSEITKIQARRYSRNLGPVRHRWGTAWRKTRRGPMRRCYSPTFSYREGQSFATRRLFTSHPHVSQDLPSSTRRGILPSLMSIRNMMDRRQWVALQREFSPTPKYFAYCHDNAFVTTQSGAASRNGKAECAKNQRTQIESGVAGRSTRP